MKRLVLSAGILIAACGAAFADGGSGGMTMNGTLSPSYQLVISGGTGVTSGGTGTAATIGLGTVVFYGNSSLASTAITQGNTGTTSGSSSGAGGTINLSFPINVEVDEANSGSTSYTLSANLSQAPAQYTTVAMGTATLTATAQPLTSTAAYGSATQYNVAITVGTLAVGNAALSQVIDISFVAN